MNAPTLMLLDVSGWVYRSHHVMPTLARQSDGLPTGAVLGYCTILWNLVRRPPAPFTHIAACFDPNGPNWRHRLLPSYKAARERSAVGRQFPLIRRATEAFGVMQLEAPDAEADDVIATYCRRARRMGWQVIVVSGDKDLMQLIGPGVRLWNTHPRKGHQLAPARWVTAEDCRRRYGVEPEQLTDVFALAGDTADNYAGVPGVGPKTAGQLVRQYGTAEAAINAADQQTPALAAALKAHAGAAAIAKQLARLDSAADCDVPLLDLAYTPPDRAAVLQFLANLEIVELADRIAKDWPLVAPLAAVAEMEATA